ncbi:mucin-5B [Oryx dammah]|uniref:mucin-5B n=1 Tax=Oryx dammah TaxID=59534 RepID=UPI001A9AAA75|nr:mucin-5B [Oryx dammah]
MGAPSGCPALLWALVALLSAGTAAAHLAPEPGKRQEPDTHCPHEGCCRGQQCPAGLAWARAPRSFLQGKSFERGSFLLEGDAPRGDCDVGKAAGRSQFPEALDPGGLVSRPEGTEPGAAAAESAQRPSLGSTPPGTRGPPGLTSVSPCSTGWEERGEPYRSRHLTFIPPITVFPTMSLLNAAHGGRVCSTWGDFHYKTFDGDVFRFPGLCNYVFSAHCGSAYEDFNLQLRRGLLGSRPTITHIVLRSQGLVLEVSNGSVLINGRREELPYSRPGLLVEQSSAYVKINIRLMLTFMWNGEDSALLELDPKYANQTCGLCGDFNGLRAVSEFYTHNARLSPLQFGNLQKLDGPTEQCQDPLPSPTADNCTDEEGVCRGTLLGPAFAPCHGLVDAEVYVAACTQDLCRCSTCPCATFAEYSRQCAHAGGQPQNWRGPDLCPQTCPLNTQHQECGSPCVDTCSNPERSQLCEDHCVDGCFCPPDTVLDDVTHTGCLPLRQCPCTHGGRTYAPGASFNTSCSSCTCSGGLWQCQDLPCPGTCSVQGGSHISTYDEKLYDVHGDCSYVLTKVCADSALTVLADLRKCGLTDNENCLKTVTLSLNGGDTTVQIQANGGVFVNSIYTQLPVSVAAVTVFRPSSFFILVQTGSWLQLQVQLAPLMQLFLWLDPAYRGQMCGLCGNFNQNQADDFRTVGGVVEATAAAFANTWKTQAACPNVKNSFEDPCSLSVENENYAQHWCSLLTRPAGPFSPCHSVVSPGPFHSNCLFDTCNCEKSEDCMCAALSSYVRACAARGVLLRGWRDSVCTKYASSCPKTQSYAHVVDSCQPTCRSLSQPDVSCDVAFVPVDGCVCPQGTFLDDAGDCVPAEACPCYLGSTVVAPGEVVHDNSVVCSCVSGRLSCLGATEQSAGCVAPMVFLDCSNASADAPGAECVRSCHTLDVDCFSTHCVSGCVCPVGLLSDGSGGCVAEEDCPCMHNEAAYKPGEVIKVDCNTCTCGGRRWQCSDRPCLGTCVAYGDGHFLTFDGDRYSFEGSCEYTLAQDYCVSGDTTNGTFRIVTENVPCGTTDITCSKAIKIFLGSYELILHEGTHRVLQRGPGGDLPYRVRYMGVYLTVETHSGVVVSWDRKTSVIIRLRREYKGRVCGLCGNFDDNALNDFTTRSQSVVGDVLEFGNSWKFSPSCPDALAPRDPCTANPHRRSWAQKQCSIISSATFSACHSQVDSTRYYDACVSDTCACDSGGDCECFCTAVAAYAQACHEAGVCVSWRTPDVCPLFCDYYNPHGECEWHYQPCGAPCLKTCRNPSGLCLMDLPGLEGCYPKCPSSKPFFNEDQMECVAQCSGCYDKDGNYYDAGTRVPTTENCQSCACTSSGLQCTRSPEACTCTYEGRTYAYGDVIYNTTDGLGACLIAVCRDNGTIVRRAMECPGTASTTPFTFTSTAAPPSTTGLVPTPSTVCVWKVCHWSDWYDGGHPEPGMSGGDFETFENLRQRGYQVCLTPVDIECEAQLFPGMALEKLGQKVECSQDKGLTCLNSEQSPPLCLNYKLRVLCCDFVPCGTSQPPSSQTTPTARPTHPTTVVPTSQTPSTKLTTTTTPEGSSSVFPGTTTCEPHCQWTEWFDVDYPKYEEGGGDFETYEKVRAAGTATPSTAPGTTATSLTVPTATVTTATVPTAITSTATISTAATSNATAPTATVVTATVPTATISAGTVPTASTASSTTSTAVPTPTQTRTQTGSTVVPGSPASSATTVPALSTGLTTRATSSSPGHTSTLPTSPRGSTGSTTPGTATSVLPTWKTSQGPTSVLATTQTSTARLQTEAPLSTTGTPSTQHPRTSTPVPATATTGPTTSQGTTSCQPKCTWTEWFDVDFPTSGVTGGDIETYDNIRAAGGKMCWDPEKIECRAESYPEVSIDQIGQVVNCSLETGLVCRNVDQSGPFTMCFNYNIRVYCCDDVRHCPATATPGLRSTSLPSSSSTATGPWPPTSTTTWSPFSTSKVLPTTPKPTLTGAPSTVTLVTSHILESTSVTNLPPSPVMPTTRATTHTHFLPPTTSKRTAQVTELPTRSSETTTRPPVSTLTTPSSATPERVSTPTSVTGPASTVTTKGVSTPTSVTGPSSTATTERVSTPTSVTGLSSTATTERVSTPTSVTGSSSTATTETTSTPTSVTGPSSTVTTERVSTPTSVTGPSSAVITKRTSTPTSTVTSERVSTPTSVTGPSSTATTERVSTLTSVTGPSSMATTKKLSISSPSPFPGSSPMTTKPDLSKTSGSLMPSVVPTTLPSPTTPCLCHVFGKFFLPGDVVYNKTDGAGCPFLAICNQRCELDRFQGACTTSSPPGTSASVPPTTPVSGCDRTIPPRKVNESWFLEDCTVARCEGDNRIILLGPRPMSSITCVNGHLPVKVQNQSHRCDYRYECECVCSGWGSGHYETFDGTSYTFRDNCTYVLMREIQPRHGNLHVLLHNRFCEAAAHCPRALSIHYQSMDVVLSTTTSADGQEESLILLDQTRVRQSFSKNGVAVTLTGATGMRVEIPAIGVSITFNGRVFQARLSYSRFNHNTEGQCGTCTNSRGDECRRPDGTVARTCRDMARSWLVSDSSGEGCGVPTGLPPTTSPLLPGTSTPAIHPSCPPEPLCELMLSSVFAGCHSLIPPGPYFNACVSDSCWPGHGREVLCQSLETYAELCRSRGVCADWRNATHGLCDLACPPAKVYKSCGPVQPESCDSRSQSLQSVGLAEGCFCPDSHILFNSHRDICVPECPCVGPDGLPKFPGERWVSNCQDCVCDEGTVSVQCMPVVCPAPKQPQECGRAGFVAVNRPLADNPCCMENLCVCNASTCPRSPPACGLGEKLVRTPVEGDCCPTFSCEPLLCSFNGTFYGVGATIPGVTPCHTCTCLSMDGEDPTVWCEEEACNTTCLQGFEYSTVAGQCCGKCVQTSCLAPDGQLVQFNETWVNSLVDNCTEYHCQARDGLPMLTPTPVVCPDVSPCKGILKKIGCCYSCVQTDACQAHANMTVLRHRGCVTQTAVKVSFCEGSCPQLSRYSMETQARQCSCSCCQETRTHQEVVTMQCPDGTAFQHAYTHVDECGCVPACASSPQTLEESASTFPTLGSTAV